MKSLPTKKQPTPQPNYVGRTFLGTDNRTYVVWKATSGMYSEEVSEYVVVALLDPTKGVQTVPYASVNRVQNKQQMTVDLHRLENVDPNTHFSVPANKMGYVLRNPSVLEDVAAPVKKNKKVISVKPRAER